MPPRSALCTAWTLALASACAPTPPPPVPPPPPAPPNALLPPSAFDSIEGAPERSRALFMEASRVLFHPRCANCHPDGDAPTQRDFERHDPPVLRGDRDRGVPGMECTSCHQDRNAELARVPGAPEWRLAPRSMAWARKSPREVCLQLKDPARNGGRTLDRVAYHTEHDALVAWAWQPGSGQTSPPPGSQAALGALVRAWVATGAECPLAQTTDGASL